MNIKLADISRALGGGDMPVRVVTKVVTDTREDCAGGLFFALVGPNYDGHAFVEDAFIAGAVSAVVRKGTGPYSRAVIEVRDTGEALLQLAAYYRQQQNVRVVGITGSVGKTTCKDMTALVLGSTYNTIKTQGNLNNHIGMPKTIFTIDDDTRMAVLEMGMSAPGEISVLTHVARPNVAIITEIGVSHLESMGTRENILRAKLEIVQGLGPGGALVINADNDMLGSYIQDAHPNVVRVGIHGEHLDIYATDIVEENWKTTFTIMSAFGSVRTHIPLMGEHNVRNALLAFTAGGLLGVKKDQAAQALTQYEPSGMRSYVTDKSGITVVADCYNASPDSMKVALEQLSRLDTEGRKIAVLGDMLELGQLSKFYHTQAGGQVVDNSIDYLLCFGDQAQFIAFEAQRRGMQNVECFTSRADLKQRLRRLVIEGDTVLFKASRAMKFEELMEALN